ncbi:unnamed protein product, partial [Effrenium voratum]
ISSTSSASGRHNVVRAMVGRELACSEAWPCVGSAAGGLPEAAGRADGAGTPDRVPHRAGGAAERGHPRDGHRADGGEAQDRGAAEGARQGKHAEEGAEGARQGASGGHLEEDAEGEVDLGLWPSEEHWWPVVHFFATIYGRRSSERASAIFDRRQR